MPLRPTCCRQAAAIFEWQDGRWSCFVTLAGTFLAPPRARAVYLSARYCPFCGLEMLAPDKHAKEML